MVDLFDAASHEVPAVTRPPNLEQHAKELLGVGPEWRMMEWRVYGPQKKPLGVMVKGCEAPLLTSGKNKGRVNWRRRDVATEATIPISYDIHEVWLRAWETEFSLCAKCQGSKQELFGWGRDTGSRYRPCRRCDATGHPLPSPPQGGADGMEVGGG